MIGARILSRRYPGPVLLATLLLSTLLSIDMQYRTMERSLNSSQWRSGIYTVAVSTHRTIFSSVMGGLPMYLYCQKVLFTIKGTRIHNTDSMLYGKSRYWKEIAFLPPAILPAYHYHLSLGWLKDVFLFTTIRHGHRLRRTTFDAVK